MSPPESLDSGASSIDSEVDLDIPWWEWEVPTNRVISSPLKITMLGYAVEDFANIGYEAFTNLLHPEDHERTMQSMRDYFAGHVPMFQTDYRIRCADGSYVWYADRGTVVRRSEEGSPLLLRGVVFNIGSTLDARDARLFRSLRRALHLPLRGRELVDVPTLCMQCRKLKTGEDSWVELGSTLALLVERPVSHGLCWDCADLLYPEVAQRIRSARVERDP